MAKEKKKQFSLTLFMRVLLGLLIVVSIGIFANSVMRYNEMLETERELKAQKQKLTEAKEQLIELVGSQEQAEALLTCYAEYLELIATNTAENFNQNLIEEKRAQLDALLADRENRAYIEQIAKEYLDLQHHNATMYPTNVPNS